MLGSGLTVASNSTIGDSNVIGNEENVPYEDPLTILLWTFFTTGNDVTIGKGVSIGAGSVIGSNAVILDGVTLPEDSMVVAGAVIGSPDNSTTSTGVTLSYSSPNIPFSYRTPTRYLYTRQCESAGLATSGIGVFILACPDDRLRCSRARLARL